MISKDFANKVLDILAGNSYKLSGFSEVWLGLSSTDPETKLTEPEEDEYVRVQVGATDQSSSATNSSNSDKKYTPLRKFGSATGGTISNNVEINFPTAKKGYKDKITHWFLSASNKKGDAAFLWGEVKDVLIEPATWEEFTTITKTIYKGKENEEEVSYLEKSEELEDLIQINTGDEYIVVWDKDDKGNEVEYKLTASVYKETVKVKEENEQGEEVEKEIELTYSVLGNLWYVDEYEENTKEPFVLLYRQEVVETETKGILKLLKPSKSGSLWMGLYGMGIKVGKKTVPTFYQDQLKASIDVEL